MNEKKIRAAVNQCRFHRRNNWHHSSLSRAAIAIVPVIDFPMLSFAAVAARTARSRSPVLCFSVTKSTIARVLGRRRSPWPGDTAPLAIGVERGACVARSLTSVRLQKGYIVAAIRQKFYIDIYHWYISINYAFQTLYLLKKEIDSNARFGKIESLTRNSKRCCF